MSFPRKGELILTIRVNNMDMPWSCENSCTQEAESREDPPVEVHSKMQTATCLSRRGWNFCPGLSCCHRVISTALDCLSVFFGMTPVLIQSIHSSRWSPILSQSLLFTCTQRTDSLSLFSLYLSHPLFLSGQFNFSQLSSPLWWTGRSPMYHNRPVGLTGRCSSAYL